MENQIPRDSYMLLSFINTQLRDHFPDLDSCCEHYDVQRGWLEEQLGRIDYQYDADLNQFV